MRDPVARTPSTTCCPRSSLLTFPPLGDCARSSVAASRERTRRDVTRRHCGSCRGRCRWRRHRGQPASSTSRRRPSRRRHVSGPRSLREFSPPDRAGDWQSRLVVAHHHAVAIGSPRGGIEHVHRPRHRIADVDALHLAACHQLLAPRAALAVAIDPRRPSSVRCGCRRSTPAPIR